MARLGLPAERYATLVHPVGGRGRARLRSVPGSVLHAGTVLTADVTLGAHVAIMPRVVLTHDDRIGDGVTFGAGACVAGGVTVEDAAYVGSGALLREHFVVGSGPSSAWARSSPDRCPPAKFGRACRRGSSAGPAAGRLPDEPARRSSLEPAGRSA